VLVAGLGNVFLGDDAFGVEVVNRLAADGVPVGVTVRDVGIRSLDLAYALADVDDVILVDAVSRGGPPGTIYVLELDTSAGDQPAAIELHGLEPTRLWDVARQLGSAPTRAFVVGCEVGQVADSPPGLSAPVALAVDGAIDAVRSLISRMRAEATADA
jgi:hydrogenase maturation protease